MIRLYGSGPVARNIVEVIQEDGLDLTVMLGAWITSEESFDEDGNLIGEIEQGIQENKEQVAGVIELATEFPEIVTAINIGNETQIWWSDHRIATERLVAYIREVREATTQPITTADDFAYWELPESATLADELDFIVTHIYAMWHGQQLDDAMTFTQDKLYAVTSAHPGKPIVIGELGWATRVHTEGLQAELIKGEAGEAQQLQFVQRLLPWVEEQGVPIFYFSAFDENWKGGPHPAEVEKHWGIYRADRTPKPAGSWVESHND
jgi:exo-beta-1,3-glucanase (GH17 family)